MQQKKKAPTHLVSVLAILLVLDDSPKSEESRGKADDAKGLEELDWFDFLRERPNNGMRVIFFLIEVASSPEGTSKCMEEVVSFWVGRS
jgi:hypothetical protein